MTRSSFALSSVTGVFSDPVAEATFREDTRKEWRQQVRFVSWNAAAFYVAGMAEDIVLVGVDSAAFAWLAGLRLATAAAIVLVVAASVRSAAETRRLDARIAALLLVVGAATATIIVISPGPIELHALTALLIVLVIYVFIPIDPVWVALGAAFQSIAFVAAGLATKELDRPQLVLVLLYLVLANVIGAYVARNLNIVRRQEYRTMIAERGALQALREEVEERSRVESALAESEERYRSLVELSPDAIVVHRDARVVFVNPRGARLLGEDEAQRLVGSSIFSSVPQAYHGILRARIGELAEGETRLPPVEIQVTLPDGRQVDCEVVSGRLNFDGAPAILSVLRIITERKRLEHELLRLATTDHLTGIRNRRSFFEHAEAEIGRCRRHDRSVSLLMIDVDRFKDVNDQHGHEAGDAVLRGLAGECRQVLREIDIFGRIGGEEFAAALTEVGLGAAVAIAERIRERVESLRETAPDGSPIAVTVSMGVAEWRAPSESLDDCLRRADRALYAAKQAGRNRVFAA